ncbi:MAG: MarR family transcriptional regulator [Lachnospiraceae bacterium]|nr:MarR family transcriptional regulator [Lachnospiraceae bacterium]
MSDNLSQKLKRYNYLVGEIDAAYHEISTNLGLSDSVMRILYTICDNGADCPLQKICRLTGLSKQTINSALRKLEKEGFIYLEPLGPKNKNVCLTDTGKHMAKQTACQVLAMENEIFASWPPEDVERYIELTEAYLRDLRNHAGKPADR